MHTIIRLLAILIASLFKSRRQLEAEILYAAQTAVEGLLAFTPLVRANLMHQRPIDRLLNPPPPIIKDQRQLIPTLCQS